MGETTALFFGDGDHEHISPIPTVDPVGPSTELGNTLDSVSTFVRPQPDYSRCDCRIQALAAIRLEALTWTLGTIPDLETWADQCAGWLVELPTDLLLQAWMGLLILVLVEHVGLSTARASDLIQLAVGRALLTKEGWR